MSTENEKATEPLSQVAESAIRDTFRGGNKHLRECIKALIELNDSNSLVPHGIGGHARTLLAACYRRLPNAKVGNGCRQPTHDGTTNP